jgi:hypothetical protein
MSAFVMQVWESVVKVRFLFTLTASYRCQDITVYLILFVKTWFKEGVVLFVPKIDLSLHHIDYVQLDVGSLSGQNE